jgi:hypothetical protein
MSYDIGNLGLKSDKKPKTWLYAVVAIVVVVVVVVATKVGGLW